MKNVLPSIAAVAALAAPISVLAQGLEPGEWQFTTTMSVPGMPKPHTQVTNQCVTQKNADPHNWLNRNASQSDCTMSPFKKSGNAVSWEVSCPKANMRGRGTARIAGGTMESEMTMIGEQQGRRIEVLTKTTGRRLGPCKS
jgi:hypothetical protein